MQTPLLELSPLMHRVASYAGLLFAALWLLRHVWRISKRGGCESCPSAPSQARASSCGATPHDPKRVSLPVIRS